MKTVWKYAVPVGQDVRIEMDAAAKILHVEAFSPDIVLFWAEVHPAPTRLIRRHFEVFGTGHDIPLGAQHLGTTSLGGGELVWHLYELTSNHKPFPDPDGVPV